MFTLTKPPPQVSYSTQTNLNGVTAVPGTPPVLDGTDSAGTVVCWLRLSGTPPVQSSFNVPLCRVDFGTPVRKGTPHVVVSPAGASGLPLSAVADSRGFSVYVLLPGGIDTKNLIYVCNFSYIAVGSN